MTKINNVQHGDLGLSTTVNITKPNLEIKAITHTSKRFNFEFLKLGKSYNVHHLEQRQREREY